MASDPATARTERTAASAIFGVQAAELVSRKRFDWKADHNAIFQQWILANGLNCKPDDLHPLLRRLDLDGYEDVRNSSNESVHKLILDKVVRKLKSYRGKLPVPISQASVGDRDTKTGSIRQPIKQENAARQAPTTGESSNEPRNTRSVPVKVTSRRADAKPDTPSSSHTLGGLPSPAATLPPIYKTAIADIEGCQQLLTDFEQLTKKMRRIDLEDRRLPRALVHDVVKAAKETRKELKQLCEPPLDYQEYV
ncbi:hypothetical protein GGR56DRAFT_616740 [Xylariaceae sp. FL0804]|nr:hypothetical protein GGR56DRAFT_616740 [Xylariaceae sp. FL0804]